MTYSDLVISIGKKALMFDAPASARLKGNLLKTLPPIVSRTRKESRDLQDLFFTYAYDREADETVVTAATKRSEIVADQPTVLALQDLNEEILLAVKVLLDYAEIDKVVLVGVSEAELRATFPSFPWDEHFIEEKGSQLYLC